MFRNLWAILLVILIALPAAAQDDRIDRVAIIVSEASEAKMQSAVEIAVQRARRIASRGRIADIRILAHGDGLRLLREDTSPSGRRLQFAVSSFESISLHACAFTQGQVQREEGTAPTILSFAQSIPNAALTIREMEDQGWSIIRP